MDRGVIATASELFEARHYPGVVAMCSDALDDEPECLPLLVIRARAHIALRRDLEAQADLRDVIRLDPRCAVGYRLLGELAARRNDNEHAALFFREALRLDPGDREAGDWLLIVDALLHPSDGARRSGPGADGPAHAMPADDDRETRLFSSRSSLRREPRRPASRTGPAPEVTTTPTLTGHPPTQPPAARDLARATRVTSPATTRPANRPSITELPGFDEYLVTHGILTRERLRAAQAYQRSMRVQLSTAIVTLGLATPQRIAWASVAHQSHLARERQAQ